MKSEQQIKEMILILENELYCLEPKEALQKHDLIQGRIRALKWVLLT